MKLSEYGFWLVPYDLKTNLPGSWCYRKITRDQQDELQQFNQIAVREYSITRLVLYRPGFAHLLHSHVQFEQYDWLSGCLKTNSAKLANMRELMVQCFPQHEVDIVQYHFDHHQDSRLALRVKE